MKKVIYLGFVLFLSACGKNFHADQYSSQEMKAGIAPREQQEEQTISVEEFEAIKSEYFQAQQIHGDQSGQKWKFKVHFTVPAAQPGTVLDSDNLPKDFTVLKRSEDFLIELGATKHIPTLLRSEWETPITFNLPCGQYSGNFFSLQMELNLAFYDHSFRMENPFPKTCGELSIDHPVSRFVMFADQIPMVKADQHIFILLGLDVFVFSKVE